MYTVTKTFRFEAAHFLPKHSGKCREMHGHSYKVELSVMADALINTDSSDGMVVDFGILSDIWRQLEQNLDHKLLNDYTKVEGNRYPPTAEWLAYLIFQKCAKLLHPQLRLRSVTVWETPDSKATYGREHWA